jgi:hypothetical protein
LTNGLQQGKVGKIRNQGRLDRLEAAEEFILPRPFSFFNLKLQEVGDRSQQPPGRLRLGLGFESYTFDNPGTPSTHTTQYFEMVDNRGIYQGGRWADARHLLPWQRDAWETAEVGQHPWERRITARPTTWPP